MVKINSDGFFRVNFNQDNSQPNNTNKIKGIRSYCWLTSLFVGMRTTIYTYKDPSSHKTYYLNAKSIDRWIFAKGINETDSGDSAQQGQSISQNATLVFNKRVFFGSKNSTLPKKILTIALNALQSDPAEYIALPTQKDDTPKLPSITTTSTRSLLQPIAKQYTANTQLDTQREAHKTSKNYLSTHLTPIGGTFMPISPTKMEGTIPSVADVKIMEEHLPEDVVSWKITRSVQDDIKAASLNKNGPYEIFQVASQANGCEAPNKYTVLPGKAWETYQWDRTQGPQAQMAFGRTQVEIVNNAGNLGFNSLVNVFDKERIGQVQDGYCTPTSDTEAQAMIDQISENYEKLEYSYIKNTPASNGRSVGQFLSFAPAFGTYSRNTINPGIRNQLEFSVALMSYRALFQAAINERRPCIVNAAGVGLGVFENNPENVAKAFYVAIKEYKDILKEKSIQVKLNLYQSKTGNVKQAGTMASYLTGLKNDGKTFNQVFQQKKDTSSRSTYWVQPRNGKSR